MKCKLLEGTSENLKQVCEELGMRGKMDLTNVNSIVAEVLDDIRQNGNAAVLKYTEKFDGAKLTPETMKITSEEIDAAIIEMDLDIEELDKLYETLESNNIEIVDDLSSAAIGS